MLAYAGRSTPLRMFAAISGEFVLRTARPFVSKMIWPCAVRRQRPGAGHGAGRRVGEQLLHPRLLQHASRPGGDASPVECSQTFTTGYRILVSCVELTAKGGELASDQSATAMKKGGQVNRPVRLGQYSIGGAGARIELNTASPTTPTTILEPSWTSPVHPVRQLIVTVQPTDHDGLYIPDVSFGRALSVIANRGSRIDT